MANFFATRRILFAWQKIGEIDTMRSISSSFYKYICAIILLPKEVQTLNVSTQKLYGKLS
jgi:hypothetical protein